MLALAIKAGIPIVRVRTTDLLNLQDVLEALAPGKRVYKWTGGAVPQSVQVVYAVQDFGDISSNTYDTYLDSGKVLILVNQGEESSFVFDAGEVPVPREMMANLLEEVASKKKIPELLPCFNGLTLKGMAEVIKLTTAKYGSLTAKHIVAMRAQLTGKVQGLAQVNTALPMYIVPDQLKDWVARNKRYFLEGTDQRLTPRGIMMAGPPGVGKSQGAKYIANEFGVPLYRLDMAGALGKFVGESEQTFSRVFAALDQEEPALVLIDEIEKLFTEHDDSGVTSRLLAQLLWWSQEHTSRVLMVLTTNDANALPKELYRAGRVDATINIQKLNLNESMVLATAVFKQFIEKPNHEQTTALGKTVRNLMIKQASKHLPQVAHAEVVQAVYDLIKVRGWV